jgi:hypothetical protein
MAAVLARHEQATDAVPAHTAERHGTDRFVILAAPQVRTNNRDQFLEREPM